MTDPSAYFDPAPEHITAPLSDMVFGGGQETTVSVLETADLQTEILISEEERDLLAAIVWHEAGNQDLYGKRLVVDVVLNRRDDPRFPNNITDIIFQPGQFTTASELYRVSPGVTEECYKAVDMEIQERSNFDVLFFNCNSQVYGEFLLKYGDHWFAR